MQYMILIYGDEKGWAGLSEAEMNAAFAAYMQYSKDLGAAGVMRGGASLQPVATATTIRVRGNKPTTTGRPLRRDEGTIGRLLSHRGRQSG